MTTKTSIDPLLKFLCDAAFTDSQECFSSSHQHPCCHHPCHKHRKSFSCSPPTHNLFCPLARARVHREVNGQYFSSFRYASIDIKCTKFVVLWVATSCSFVGGYGRFGGICCRPVRRNRLAYIFKRKVVIGTKERG
jgi:hypothetical protein